MRDSAYCKLKHLVKVRTNLEYIGDKTCQNNFFFRRYKVLVLRIWICWHSIIKLLGTLNKLFSLKPYVFIIPATLWPSSLVSPDFLRKFYLSFLFLRSVVPKNTSMPFWNTKCLLMYTITLIHLGEQTELMLKTYMIIYYIYDYHILHIWLFWCNLQIITTPLLEKMF